MMVRVSQPPYEPNLGALPSAMMPAWRGWRAEMRLRWNANHRRHHVLIIWFEAPWEVLLSVMMNSCQPWATNSSLLPHGT